MEHLAKIVNGKNSFTKNLIWDVWQGSEYASVRCVTWLIEWKNSKKKPAVNKFLIRNFINLIQSYDISQDIWENIFALSSISPFAFSFVILVWVAVCDFNNRWSRQHANNRDWYFHLVQNCKFQEQTSAKRYHPSKTKIDTPKGSHFLFFPFLVLMYSGFLRCVCSGGTLPPFRQLNNLVNHTQNDNKIYLWW